MSQGRPMTQSVDLAIVGAGPAGLSAAIVARAHGLEVTVLDEQASPGGQIYRAVEDVAERRRERFAALGPDYQAGLDLVQRFRASGALYRPQVAVWRIDADGTVYHAGGAHRTDAGASASGASSLVARAVLIATGAIERPVPIPGWTLPGVLACGGAQVLLKSADLVPAGRTLLAGSGPLLWLYAWQLLRAGVKIAGVLDTTPRANLLRALPHLPRAIGARGYLAKGLRMMNAVARAGIPIRRGVTRLRAEGDARVRFVSFERAGRVQREPVDTLLLHEGVIPNVNLPFSVGCERIYDEAQRCFRPIVSAAGETTVPNVFVAGDGAGIGGAKAAEHGGTISALAIVARLRRGDDPDARRSGAATPPDAQQQLAAARRQQRSHLRIRPFLDALYRPAASTLVPRDDDTIACRCEEVTIGQVRALVAQGCVGPNQMKAFVRCGMGPCQGRMCGSTVVEAIAEARGVSPGEVGYYRIRSPVKPITVGELANLSPDDYLPPAEARSIPGR
jgi:NADPH-dependent 2,4-dienoyl-CoA reductase/sulfur reductase-like enzyme